VGWIWVVKGVRWVKQERSIVTHVTSIFVVKNGLAGTLKRLQEVTNYKTETTEQRENKDLSAARKISVPPEKSKQVFFHPPNSPFGIKGFQDNPNDTLRPPANSI